MVRRRFRWIRNPVPEPEPEILAMAGPLPEKIAPFILSDLPTPLQKHHDSANTPIADCFAVGEVGRFGQCQRVRSRKCGIFSTKVSNNVRGCWSWYCSCYISRQKCRYGRERECMSVSVRGGCKEMCLMRVVECVFFYLKLVLLLGSCDSVRGREDDDGIEERGGLHLHLPSQWGHFNFT